MREKKIYLSGLNGLRAFAALSVVIGHTFEGGIGDFGLPHLFNLPMAGFGVTLFFVISGFLITYLLLQEVRKTSTVDVKKFYVRRVLRIWPIYYLFIIVCVCVFYFLGISQKIVLKEMWFYIFFAANIPFIFNKGILILVHYWSIGVEEQFYLFWPWLVRFSKQRLLKVAILIFVCLFLVRVGFWFYLGPTSIVYRFLMVTRFQCMMVGAIGAILYFNQQSTFIKLFSNKMIQILSWLVFLLMGFNIIYIPKVISHELIAIASLGMIIGQITVTKRIVNLEVPFFDFIGKISYGMYVIHPLIILLLSKYLRNLDISWGLNYMVIFACVLITTVLVSWLSYTYFEKPFLRLKDKFTVVKSSNSMQTK